MPHCAADVICEDPDDHGADGDEGQGAEGDETQDADAEDTDAEDADEQEVDGETEDDSDGELAPGFSNDELAQDAEEASAAAVASLTERVEAVGEPVELDAFGLEGSMNAFAAALVAVGMSLALIAVGVRNWRNGWRIPARYLRFTLVSLFGVGLSLGLWEVVSNLSGDLAVIPEETVLQGDLWSNPFAGITIPAIEVLLDAQPWIVGFLIVSLPLAAAISIFSAFDRFLYVVAALVVANIIWLPLVVILASRLLLSENAAHAGWWALIACLSVLGVNGLATAGTSSGGGKT